MAHLTDQQKFQTDFHAKEYLKNYYAKADLMMVHKYVVERSAAAETMRIMMFLNAACSPLIRAFFGQEKAVVLELGGGPTLYQLMNIASEVKEIHFTDYVDDNLDEIRAWKNKRSGAFNWKDFFKAALMIQNDTIHVTDQEIAGLERELRRKITTIGACDIFQKGLGVRKRSFDIINTHFVADSATTSKNQWRAALKHMHDKLNRKGLLFMSALRGAKSSYKVLDKTFPAVELYEKDMEAGLKQAGFDLIRVSSIHTEDTSNHYEGFMFVVAQKK
ncbi:MAG: hypothetical protein HY461_02045 [Parcubacteria group bacterium]|nr:hypothetical protein [Parcubacteria group bacterium]